MKRFLKKLEDLFVAITFAEAGDVETARQVLKEDEKQGSEGLRIQTEDKKRADLTAQPVKS
ncbi:MAG: hypothetical protein ACK415_11730 [Thermodesulfovibrionales bacterium]